MQNIDLELFVHIAVIFFFLKETCVLYSTGACKCTYVNTCLHRPYDQSQLFEEGKDQELIQSDPQLRPPYPKGQKSQHEVMRVNK